MQIADATILITGANRGLGLEFARAALARGARKVYAGARDPSRVTLAGVIPLKLDVTGDEQVAAAVRACGDVTLVINNAGIAEFGGVLADGSIDAARRHMETNFLGMLRMSRAFAPVIAGNGGGAFLNVLSVVSWISPPRLAVYATSKAAAWSLNNALRNELHAQGIQVLGLHAGFIDTDMTRDIDAPKARPEDIVGAAFDALERGASEVAADELSRQVRQGLGLDPAIYLQPAAA